MEQSHGLDADYSDFFGLRVDPYCNILQKL